MNIVEKIAMDTTHVITIRALLRRRSRVMFSGSVAAVVRCHHIVVKIAIMSVQSLAVLVVVKRSMMLAAFML